MKIDKTIKEKEKKFEGNKGFKATPMARRQLTHLDFLEQHIFLIYIIAESSL